MACKALYLHVPFCTRKCPYCDFYSVAADEAAMDAYVSATVRALAHQPYGLTALDTLYFGGGTPSLLGARRLTLLLEAAQRAFALSADAEVTVEGNPQSLTAEVLSALHSAGANRLSVGMQSVNDRQLAALGRPHSVDDTAHALDRARAAGFAHISLDLMLATPGQNEADIDAAVAFCARHGAEHVSAYLLKVEPDTPFARQHIERACPDDDRQADLYLHAVQALAAQGYAQYEISNFARDGCVARHNLTYWHGAEYLGVGPSAHSFVAGKRFFFPRDLAAYLAAPDSFALCVDDGTGGDHAEQILLRLRLTEGVAWQQLAVTQAAAQSLRTALAPLAQAQLVVCDTRGLHLTPRGFLVSNAVIAAVLEAVEPSI